ncbi:MAG: hypothetical protein VKN33_11045, partial [Candidatus Sericytochromatia bacterium]|nr:hypothetical protein [Candidatus Sericytochromatia bacterium]
MAGVHQGHFALRKQARSLRKLLLASLLALWMPVEQTLAAPTPPPLAARMGPAEWDLRTATLSIPYERQFPRYTILNAGSERWVLEFDAVPGLLGVYSSGSPAHPCIAHWVLAMAGADRVRLTLTLRQESRVQIRDDVLHRKVVVLVVPLARVSTPVPTP